MHTVFLHPQTWDLELDTQGNIAYAIGDYAIAQDVASAARLWRGEIKYELEAGVDYEGTALSPRLSSYAQYKHDVVRSCKRVPEVVDIDLSVTTSSKRILSGDIIISTDTNTYKVNAL